MKRILVIDESEVVRETLALILGREFAVVKRPPSSREAPLAETGEDVDLLILGVTPRLGSEAAALLNLAAQLPFAVLFLVDSKSIARSIQTSAEVTCLAKPFNPYELHEKVGQLLTRRDDVRVIREAGSEQDPDNPSQYLEYPYLGRSAAVLARRFAAARLPLLLLGEVGCGQDRVAAAICGVDKTGGLRLSINAAELSEDYLAQLAVRIGLQAHYRIVPTSVIIQNLDKSSPASQTLILRFLEEISGKYENIRLLTTANLQLLDRVYRGEFLEALYYRLATLTLKLLPLRERREDIPVLAEWLAGIYAKRLGLSVPQFSVEAKQRLSNYLWFGNVGELESVIASTLAFHRKPYIDEADFIFEFSGDPQPDVLGNLADFVPVAPSGGTKAAEPKLEIYSGTPARSASPAHSANGHTKVADLKVVIHELAHELKNPMVTIKTFAQLLGERYQDEQFRSRFQEVVGSDIERMDDLLEAMLEFAEFAGPRRSKVALTEKLRSILTEIQDESTKRQTRFEWKGNGSLHEIHTDESQLQYILKNFLLVALWEARRGSTIEVDVSRRGTLAISYLREGPRVAPISQYLEEQSSSPTEAVLPLRVLLAKHLLERNGGQLRIDPSDGDKETLKLEFPLAEH
jgi:DNA-binding NtrC family response regulator